MISIPTEFLLVFVINYRHQCLRGGSKWENVKRCVLRSAGHRIWTKTFCYCTPPSIQPLLQTRTDHPFIRLHTVHIQEDKNGMLGYSISTKYVVVCNLSSSMTCDWMTSIFLTNIKKEEVQVTYMKFHTHDKGDNYDSRLFQKPWPYYTPFSYARLWKWWAPGLWIQSLNLWKRSASAQLPFKLLDSTG